MDVATTRLNNLRTLVDRHTQAGRTKKEAAVALDMSASFLSQLLGGKKMGDDVARKIEATAELQHGWMDTPHTSGANVPHVPGVGSQSGRLDASTLAAAIRLAHKACDNLDLEFDAEEIADAEIVLRAADYLAARSERSVTVDNLVDFTKRLREINKGTSTDEGISSARRVGSGTGRKGQAQAG